MIEGILTDTQRAFLKSAGAHPFISRDFYLTGGTALAAFYLGHRYSEDLDFFAEKEVDILAVDIFLKEIRQSLGITAIDFQQSYNRNLFFLHFGDGAVLKTEFTHFPFTRIEKGLAADAIAIDSILDIAVNKLFTIYQQSRTRDYIDLYCICTKEQFSISDLLLKAKTKFDWHIDSIQLGTQFMKAGDVKDYPRMIRTIDDVEWQEFFRGEAKKLAGDIIK